MKRTDSFSGYSGETTEELLSYPPSSQHDVLVRAFEEGIQRKATRRGEVALTSEERVVLAVRSFDREVNNGGFDQFFRNSSRRFAPMIVDSLLQIGCKKQAEVAQRAVRALHLLTLSANEIVASMNVDNEERDQELERCDQLFYRTQIGIAKHLYSFIKANKSRIEL